MAIPDRLLPCRLAGKMDCSRAAVAKRAEGSLRGNHYSSLTRRFPSESGEGFGSSGNSGSPSRIPPAFPFFPVP